MPFLNKKSGKTAVNLNRKISMWQNITAGIWQGNVLWLPFSPNP